MNMNPVQLVLATLVIAGRLTTGEAERLYQELQPRRVPFTISGWVELLGQAMHECGVV